MKSYNELLEELVLKNNKNKQIFENKVRALRNKCKKHNWKRHYDQNGDNWSECLICGITE